MSTRWQREMYEGGALKGQVVVGRGVSHVVEDPPTAPSSAEPPSTSSVLSNVPVTITTQAQFDAALAAAPGAVLVDFGMEGCGACEDEAPKVARIASQCPGVTVLKVDVYQLEELADRFGVEGTPTLMYSKTGAEMVPGTAEEMANADSARRKIKCAVVRDGTRDGKEKK